MVSKKLIFLYFVIFPFSQLLRISLGKGITIHPADILVLFIGAVTLIAPSKFPDYFQKLKNLWFYLVFSLSLSLFSFDPNKIVTGSLYLLRFVAYGVFSIYIWRLAKKDEFKKLILQSLLVLGIFIAGFGWLQYFIFPDLRALYYYGWDDHLFRLVSTFLDPAFTGIILVLTILVAFLQKRKLTVFFLLTSLAFTYSRSSFLALLAGFLFLFRVKQNRKSIFLFATFFIALVFLLPHPAGEGVNLGRINSPRLKLINYQESLVLFKKAPIFGLGFNNICIAKQKFLKNIDSSSHSCSGLDNSFSFILTTAGIIGLVIFFDFSYYLLKNTNENLYGNLFKASLVSLSLHSFFTNTLFYPWVMGWLAILVGISRRKSH